ncbi:DMT family transporter [Rhodobacteraceae bacterium CCMM004]|nr:DMT family transporter [Rhodobacteraceae bacterium CCMM004]
MVGAMAAFAVADLCIKLASVTVPIGQIIAVMGGGGALLFALIAAVRGLAPVSRSMLHRAVVFRNGCEIVGTLGIVTALTLAPLSTTAAILQATPLAVTLGAALVLGEAVGWRRWAAVTVGFGGVLVMLRPGGGVEPGAVFALVAVAGLSARDLATRFVPAETHTLHLAISGFGSLVPAGLVVLVATGAPVRPDPQTALWLAGAVVFAAAAYGMITLSLRMGEVSAVTPFRYSRLLFLFVLAMVVLGERPDPATWLGAAIVVAAGLYTLWRERRAARANPLPLPLRPG